MDLYPNDHHNEQLRERVHPTHWEQKPSPGGYDFIAIGGGTAGLVATGGAAMLGARVALVEETFTGGDCLVSGCVPSKSLLYAAKLAHHARKANNFGITTGSVDVDFSAVMERLRQTRSIIAKDDSAESIRKRNIDLIYGRAVFVSNNRIRIDDTEVPFKRAIVCTGSRPFVPDIPGLREACPLTNETLFNLTELPRSIAILGGGPIGCEMAQALARLGSKVTIISRSQLLPKDDPEASAIVARVLKEEGVELKRYCELESVSTKDGRKTLGLYAKGKAEMIVTDHLLVATGRIPNTGRLNLEAANIEYNAAGIIVNDYQQTSNPRVYAAGDVSNALKFTHSAYAFAEYATLNALLPLKLYKTSKRPIPWTTYTDPEVAHVGLPYSTLSKHKGDYDCHESRFVENDRSKIENSTEGFVKLYSTKGTGKLVAATVVGENAGEHISHFSLALNGNIDLSTLNQTVHPYPTRAEALRKATDSYYFEKLTPTLKKGISFWIRLLR